MTTNTKSQCTLMPEALSVLLKTLSTVQVSDEELHNFLLCLTIHTDVSLAVQKAVHHLSATHRKIEMYESVHRPPPLHSTQVPVHYHPIKTSSIKEKLPIAPTGQSLLKTALVHIKTIASLFVGKINAGEMKDFDTTRFTSACLNSLRVIFLISGSVVANHSLSLEDVPKHTQSKSLSQCTTTNFPRTTKSVNASTPSVDCAANILSKLSASRSNNNSLQSDEIQPTFFYSLGSKRKHVITDIPPISL